MTEYQKASCPSCHQTYKVSPKVLKQPFQCKKCHKTVRLMKKETKQESTTTLSFDRNADQWLDEQDNSLLKRILKYEMASQEQIQKGLSLYYQHKMDKKPIRLGGILVQQGIITQNELDLFDTFQDMNKVTDMDRSFAALALKNKLVGLDHIKQAFSKQAEHFKKTKQILLIGDILTKLGMMTPAYRDAILSRQKRLDTKYEDTSFGAVAIKMGLATRDQIDDALASQQKIFSMTNQLQLLGNILVDKNILTNAQTRQILIHQKELKQQAELKNKQRKEALKQKNKKNNKTNKVIDIQKYVNIMVSKDNLEAHISPVKSLPEETTLDDILYILSENNIKYGIVHHYQIRSYLKNPLLQQSPWLIARGKPPIQPEDQTIQYKFKYLLEKISNGSDSTIVQFNHKHWPRAKKGDVLAERIPGVDGMPGISVHAEIIDVESRQTIQLINGTGTKLSPDENQIIALNDGLISLYMTNKVCVLAENLIDGDLDISEKPFRFDGAIIVKGTIKGGNSLKSVMIFANQIEQADIHVDTDIIVLGNISNARIYAKGNVLAQSIHHSAIEAFGHVLVQNDIESSHIVSSGQISIIKGTVKETELYASQGIIANSILSTPEKNCLLSIGQDRLINEEMNKINTRLPPLKKNLQKLYDHVHKIKKNITQLDENEKKIKTFIQNCHRMAKDLNTKENISEPEKHKKKDQIDQKIALATDKMNACQKQSQKNKENYLKYNTSYQQYLKQVKHMNEELATLKSWISTERKQAGIKISNTVNQGTSISCSTNKLILDQDYSHIYIQELSLPDNQSSIKISELSGTPN